MKKEHPIDKYIYYRTKRAEAKSARFNYDLIHAHGCYSCRNSLHKQETYRCLSDLDTLLEFIYEQGMEQGYSQGYDDGWRRAKGREGL